MKTAFWSLSLPVVLLLGAWLVWPGAHDHLPAGGSIAEVFPEKVRGVSWEARDSVMPEHIQSLAPYHVNWIAQTPFGWQQSERSPEITFHGQRGLWGERDHGLVRTAELARNIGVKTLLKPHIWLRRPSEGKWRSDIEMDSPDAWAQWFADYKTFILHHAQLAEANGFEALCIGTELYIPSSQHEAEWRDIIAAVREVYHGKLTYAANFYKEYEEVAFWDALDFIGVQAYFPLTEQKEPSLNALKKGWQPHFRQLKALSQKWGKPVVFTEVGYRSSRDAGIHPWEWEPRGEVPAKEISPKTQALCYQAMFETFWHEDWMEGVFVWKWGHENYQSPEALSQGRRMPSPLSFSPKDDALLVLQDWFGR